MQGENTIISSLKFSPQKKTLFHLNMLWKERQMMQVKTKAMKLSVTLLIPTASKIPGTAHDDITLIVN